MTRSDLHSHVIPETIIQAMRDQPDVYHRRIEGEGHMVGSEQVVIGTDSPFDMGEEQPAERLDAVPRLTDEEREDVSYRSAIRLFRGEV
jgi:hypothetical protein